MDVYPQGSLGTGTVPLAIFRSAIILGYDAETQKEQWIAVTAKPSRRVLRIIQQK